MLSIFSIPPVSPSIELSSYRDQHFRGPRVELEHLLRQSTTLYVGNLSFYTTEEQIYELFSKCGEIKRIVMGLDKFRKTPCGFCFVEYYNRTEAENCMRYVNGTKLDDRIIRTDWDAGFVEGRQYGRGKSGGQVRDEYRGDFDPGRGGYGKIVDSRLSAQAPDPDAEAEVMHLLPQYSKKKWKDSTSANDDDETMKD